MLHQVATGYIIKNHGSVVDLFPLVFESVTINGVETKGDYSSLENLFSNSLTIGDVLINDLEEKTEFKFYPDIKMYNGIPRNSDNFDIKIGDPTTCAQMIYIVEDGDYSDDDDNNTFVSDNTVIELINWKNKLVLSGRMVDTNFCAIKNCCS